jgi:hypothetical protein
MSADEQKRFIAEMRDRREDASAFEKDPRERSFSSYGSLVDERLVPAGRSNRSPCSRHD